MSAGSSFWKRVGHAFRGEAGLGCGNGNRTELSTASAEHGEGRGEVTAGEASVFSSLLPWRKRRNSLRRLDERYQHMLELVDAIRDHFERQDRRGAELAAGIERMGRTLEQLTEAQCKQADCFASLAARVDETARHAGGLSKTLVEMPAALNAQAQAVRAVAQQLEAARAVDGELVACVRRFGEFADTLRDSGASQLETLRDLGEASRGQAASLQSFVRRQTRLLLIITIAVAGLGLAAAAILVLVARAILGQ